MASLDARYRHLNASVLSHINQALEDDPTTDLEVVLRKLCTYYAKIRHSIDERLAKQRAEKGKLLESQQPTKPTNATPRALNSFISCKRIPSQTDHANCLAAPPPSLNPYSPPHSVIHPLSPSVCELLDISRGSAYDLPLTVIGHALSGTVLWEHSSRAVIQIGQCVAIKVGQYLNHDEHGILQFVEEHFPKVPAPRALGLITIGSTSFMFMTIIPGATLETRWPSLSAEAKANIRDVLDGAVATLRDLELPCGAAFGSPVGQRLCKDVRRDDRVSASPLYSEAQFNDFLLESRSCRAAPSYKQWLRSMLREDHRIVFTHADLHQGNVMIVDGPDGSVELSGIIDWESSGFYPEYWEHLKALNTRAISDTSDWWDYLPPSILGYDHEVVLDRVIESTVVY